MKRKILTSLVLFSFLIVALSAVPVQAQSIIGGGFVIGGGNLANGASYGGNVMGMKDGRIRGEWQHTHGALTFHGYASFLICHHDGGPGPDVPRAEPNRAVFGGAGTWQGQPGYLWIVAVADRKEGADAPFPLSDAYAICIYRDLDGNGIATSTDPIIYEVSECISGGNVQVVPPTKGHPYVPCSLTEEMERIANTLPHCTGS